VLETLEYLRHQTKVWFEITTLLIPGENDGDDELHGLARWIVDHLGGDVPLHFSAFHPDWKMTETPATPAATLSRARAIAIGEGVRFVYTGNVHDPEGGSTWCPDCGQLLIERDWYRLGRWALLQPVAGGNSGCCRSCGGAVPGYFEAEPGLWGAKRLPVRLQRSAGVI
jgi:pyruvate formate lyase activating enzyme